MSSSAPWVLLALAAVGGLIYLLQPVLGPFLFAALLAYLGDPLADRLEARGLGRTGAVVLVFLALSLALTLGLLGFLPLLVEQLRDLLQRLPGALAWLESTARPWLEHRFGLALPSLESAEVNALLREHWQSTGELAGQVLRSAFASGAAVLGTLATLALVPVVTFYLLRDWDRLIAQIQGLLPRDLERVLTPLARECDEVIAAFLRGQLLVMLALGTLYAAGLALVGLDFALLIGLVAGLASLVPYLGLAVGLVLAGGAALFQGGDPLTALAGVGAVFAVGQTLEGMVLVPWLVGDRIGLHPVAVIFAVLAGGQLFGFTGILLALPVAAVIAVALRHAHEPYLRSRFYGGRQDPEA